MSRRRRSTMSEQLKNELAKDLGFYDTVQREGWGGIKAKDAGNMVKRAIQMAEEAAAKQYQAQQPAAYGSQQQPMRSSTYGSQTQPMQAQAQAQASHAVQPPIRPAVASSVPPYVHQTMKDVPQQTTPFYQ